MGRSDHPDLLPDIEVRTYMEGDEAAIVPFLEKNMGWPATSTAVDHLEHWRWKFLANPLGFHRYVWRSTKGGWSPIPRRCLYG
jgi:hypothetical protein